MKTSKKWTIHIACYVIAALALSVLNELHPAVKYRTEVIEPQTEAMQPTAVIDLDNDNPYAYAGQESDGKLYVSGDSSYGKGYRAWLKKNPGTNAVKSC